MWHQGGGTGCAPHVVSGAGQLFSSHACWDASCFKTITSPSCYYTQLWKKIHPFCHYWHKLDINIKFSMIWFSICFLSSLLTKAQLQAALTHSAQKNTFGVGIAQDGALWWRLIRKVMSWVQIAWFASKMICIEVLNATQKCQKRERIFIGLFLVPLKLPTSLLSPLMWSTHFLGDRQSCCSSA